MLLFQFGFTVPFYLFRLRKELFIAFYYLQKLLKPTINLIIGWVFHFLCSLYIAPWMLGFVGMTINPIEIFYFTPFQHLYDRSHHLFFTPKFTESSFKFSKKRLLFNARLLYLLYIIAIFDLWQFIFGDYYFYKTEWKRLWAMVSKTRSTLDDCVFYFGIRYYNVYKNSCFK
jgi:hypothetical protein